MTNHILDKFFKPESIAIVGASSKENSIGRILIENLQKDGFPGSIYPINPRSGKILGIPAFPSILAVPASLDLAIVAIPIQGVPEIMRECGQAKVPAVIIISAGGKEVGEVGQEIEAEIKAAAEAGSIRYLGPNCMGLLCPATKLNASFAAHSAKPGGIAFLSQSGAICSAILDWAEDRSTAEFAVIVADPWQGKGLGEKLIERVIEIARDNEVKMLWGEVLAANLPMLSLVKKLGFTIKATEEGVRRVEMPLIEG